MKRVYVMVRRCLSGGPEPVLLFTLTTPPLFDDTLPIYDNATVPSNTKQTKTHSNDNQGTGKLESMSSNAIETYGADFSGNPVASSTSI